MNLLEESGRREQRQTLIELQELLITD